MSIDLTAAVSAATRASESWRVEWSDPARAAVEAAAPLIEAAVRAEIAQAIEEAAPPWRGSFAGPGQNPVDMASMDGELHGYIAAARIARGVA